jgi:hypothetical protein
MKHKICVNNCNSVLALEISTWCRENIGKYGIVWKTVKYPLRGHYRFRFKKMQCFLH